MNVIPVDLKPESLAHIVEVIKALGPQRAEQTLVERGVSRSFARVLIKRLSRRAGW